RRPGAAAVRDRRRWSCRGWPVHGSIIRDRRLPGAATARPAACRASARRAARLGRCIVNCCCRNNCRRMVAMAPGPSPRICLLLGVLFAFAALPAVARQPALMDANGGGASTCPLTADAEPDAEPVRPDKRAAAPAPT